MGKTGCYNLTSLLASKKAIDARSFVIELLGFAR